MPISFGGGSGKVSLSQQDGMEGPSVSAKAPKSGKMGGSIVSSVTSAVRKAMGSNQGFQRLDDDGVPRSNTSSPMHDGSSFLKHQDE